MNHSEIEQRILDLLDGEMDAYEKRALQVELMADTSLMNKYLAYAKLDNMLHLKHEEVCAPVVPVERIVNWQRKKAVKMACIGAAAILLLTCIFMKIYMVKPPEPLLVFRVSEHAEFVLGHSVKGEKLEVSELRIGSDMMVTSGVVELTFQNGVKSIITAPAHFTLHKEDRLYLDHGIAWFHVPAGAEGFTVITPDVEVVDLGTEFGVLSAHDRLDEVHVFKGRVQVNSLNHLQECQELKCGNALIVGAAGRLKHTEVEPQYFLSSLPNKKTPQIVFSEQFNQGISDWFSEGGKVNYEVGDFGANWSPRVESNCLINVEGNSDHSSITFDSNGREIPSSGQGYVSIGSRSAVGVSINTNMQVYRGLSYRVYFRYAGSHREEHSIKGTFSIGDQIATSGDLLAPVAEWKSGVFTFTPKISGVAQLMFDDAMTKRPENSDLLLDSVVVTAVPAKAATEQ